MCTTPCISWLSRIPVSEDFYIAKDGQSLPLCRVVCAEGGDYDVRVGILVDLKADALSQ